MDSHTDVNDVGRLAQAAGVKALILSHFVPSDGGVTDEQWHGAATKGFDGEVVVGHDLRRK